MAKTQWHPAFCAAMKLELRGNPTLHFTNEFNLTEKPLEVDMLIINKPAHTRIDNEIGEFFGEHNLLEYKAPTDHDFNGFAVFQALSYAYYYCDRYRTRDVTLTLVVSREHFNLVRWLESEGMRCEKRHDGVYTVQGINFLKMQLVVTEELDGGRFQWLSVLTDRLTAERARSFVTMAGTRRENEEMRLAEAIAQVVASANEGLFEKLKEEGVMEESALMRLMKPEVEKYAREYAEEYAKEYAKERDVEHVKAMIRRGVDNEFIRSIVDVTDEEINELRKVLNPPF